MSVTLTRYFDLEVELKEIVALPDVGLGKAVNSEFSVMISPSAVRHNKLTPTVKVPG
jgi:hypothetical protein